MKISVKNSLYRSQRFLLTTAVLPLAASVSAAVISNGGTNYSLTAQALAEMTDEVVLTMGYVVGLLYAVASLLAIYNFLFFLAPAPPFPPDVLARARAGNNQY